MRVAPTGVVASNSLRTALIRVMQVEARERHREDAVDAVPRGPGPMGFCGHGQDDDRDAEVGLVDLLDELEALDPCPGAARRRGRRPAGAAGSVAMAFEPSASTSSSLTVGLRVQQAADVLRDLGHVLDDEQARLITRSHRADDTTGHATARPTRRSAVRPIGRPGWLSGPDGEQDRPLAARPERTEVVVAGEHLDDQPGVLGEAAQLVGGDQAEPVATDPAARRARPDRPPRRSWSG